MLEPLVVAQPADSLAGRAPSLHDLQTEAP